jgi:hypothetical protein
MRYVESCIRNPSIAGQSFDVSGVRGCEWPKYEPAGVQRGLDHGIANDELRQSVLRNSPQNTARIVI